LTRIVKFFPILLFIIIISFQQSINAVEITSVCFTPGQNCTAVIVKVLSEAKTSVYVQAYSFTSAPIAKALIDAQKRGVHVEVILDKSNLNQRYSSDTFLKNQGIPTYIDSKHAIAHNKIMIIDVERVITGSFNFTKAAEEHNAENLLVIKDKKIAEEYMRNWNVHRNHSARF
jgi:phosphatidylserine/phosphatidylglycerophosphate/cardiolipin synthase-like enzyme